MKKGLVITEKPDMMQNVRAAYQQYGHEDDLDFTTFIGHTMTLLEPEGYKTEWKKWDIQQLPMIPEQFVYVPSKDKVAKYKDMKALILKEKYDYIVNCCDAGREGQHIFHAFYDGLNLNIPVKRMWLNDLTAKEIKRGMDNMIDYEQSDYLKNMTLASKYRAYFDWLVGLNSTRMITLGNQSNSGVVPVGRVMTPILKMVVDRDLEINNFKSVPFWEVIAQFKHENGEYLGTYYDHNNENNKIFLNEDDALRLKNAIQTKGVILKVNKKQEVKYAPSLHSLQDLQSEANRKYGYTMEETLNLVQALYEKKILSYPRTDCQHITTAITEDFQLMINACSNVPDLNGVTSIITKDKQNEISKNKKYVNDKRVTDHYAIVPTGTPVNFGNLPESEQHIFELVAKRFIAIFLPPLLTNKTQIITGVEDMRFETVGSIVEDMGFTKIYGTQAKELMLPNISEKDSVDVVNTELNAKKTNPPKHYTDDTLGSALSNVGRMVEDEEMKEVFKEAKGLGTTATRAGILKKLLTLKMLKYEKKGKTNFIKATDFGFSIMASIHEFSIAKPELTGEWEGKLQKIEAGELEPSQFYKEMIEYVETSIAAMKQKNIAITNPYYVPKNTGSGSATEVIGKCPKCQGAVKNTTKFYICENYKKTCDLIIGKTIAGANITKTEAKKLLNNKETKELEFTWKSGKKGNAKLEMKDGKINFVFSNNYKK